MWSKNKGQIYYNTFLRSEQQFFGKGDAYMTRLDKIKLVGKVNMVLGIVAIPIFVILLVLSHYLNLIYNINESLARGFGIMFLIFFVVAESVSSVYIVISGIIIMRGVFRDRSFKAFIIIDAVTKMLFAVPCGVFAVIMLMLYFYSAGVLGLLYSIFLIAVGIFECKCN